jgi:hypothetical protein
MGELPIDVMFAGAIAMVLVMGGIAIVFVLRRASVMMGAASVRSSDAMARVDKSVALQQEAIDLVRESISVQRETNRLLGELIERARISPSQTDSKS